MTPAPLSPREIDLEARLSRAETRLLRMAVKLLKHANDTETIRLVVLEATGEIHPQNGNSPVNEVVPFWQDLSRSQKFKIKKMLETRQCSRP